MAEGLDDSGTAAVRQIVSGWSEHAEPVARTTDQRDYDVGPYCPRDDLQRRLDEARARLRLTPSTLGAPLRWSI
jgi:hypothetical protein